jgi:hypothetical protein
MIEEKRMPKPPSSLSSNEDQLPDDEIARRMERNIRRFMKTPPQPHGKNPNTPAPVKPKERPTSKGRVRKES